jgi:hypothetical protein
VHTRAHLEVEHARPPERARQVLQHHVRVAQHVLVAVVRPEGRRSQ